MSVAYSEDKQRLTWQIKCKATITSPTDLWTMILKPLVWHYGRGNLFFFFEQEFIIFGQEGGPWGYILIGSD